MEELNELNESNEKGDKNEMNESNEKNVGELKQEPENNKTSVQEDVSKLSPQEREMTPAWRKLYAAVRRSVGE